MKPALFLIGMILSALGILLGIAYGSEWLTLLFIGLFMIVIFGNTNSDKFCIKFAEYYFNQVVKNKSKLTTKELLNKFKNEYYG